MGPPGRGSSGSRGGGMDNERDSALDLVRANRGGRNVPSGGMGAGGEFNLKPQQPMMSAGIGSAAASQSVHGTRSTAPEAEQLQVKIFLSQSLINHFIAAKKSP